MLTRTAITHKSTQHHDTTHKHLKTYRKQSILRALTPIQPVFLIAIIYIICPIDSRQLNIPSFSATLYFSTINSLSYSCYF